MEISENRMVEIVKDYLDLSITHDTNNWSNVDCRIYNESTADGYDVFVVTEHQDSPIICEDVFYYDHGLADEFKERIRYGVKSLLKSFITLFRRLTCPQKKDLAKCL